MKKVYILLILSICYSCKNELDVQINEPLSEDVIEKFQKSDSMFTKRYNEIRLLVDSAYQNKTSLNISYNNLESFNKKMMDEYKILVNSKEFINEYNTKFEESLKKFNRDSITYTKQIVLNDYSNYFDIDVLRIFKNDKYFLLPKDDAEIIISPKSNITIRRIKGAINITPIDQKADIVDSVIGIAHFDYNGSKNKPFKLTATELDYKLSDYVDIPVEVIKKKYRIE